MIPTPVARPEHGSAGTPRGGRDRMRRDAQGDVHAMGGGGIARTLGKGLTRNRAKLSTFSVDSSGDSHEILIRDRHPTRT